MAKINDKTEQYVISMLRKEFSFLESEFQYSLMESIIQSEAVPIRNSFTYTNLIVHREFCIEFLTNSSHFIFSIAILKLPYRDITDYFSFRLFLDSLGIKLSLKLPLNSTNEEVAFFLKELSSNTNIYLKELLMGKDWLNNFYPRKD